MVYAFVVDRSSHVASRQNAIAQQTMTGFHPIPNCEPKFGEFAIAIAIEFAFDPDPDPDSDLRVIFAFSTPG